MVVFGLTRTAVVLVIIACLTLTIISPGLASSLDDKRQQLQDINAQIYTNKQLQVANEQRQLAILQEIQKNDTAISDVQRQLIKIQAHLEVTKAQRKAADQKLAEMEAALEVQRIDLARTQAELGIRRSVYNQRLSSIYKDRGAGLMEVMLGSRSFNDFLERVSVLGILARSDAQLIADMRQLTEAMSAAIERISKDRESTEQQRQLIAADEQQIAALESDLTVKQARFEQELTTQRALLSQAQQEQTVLVQAEDVLDGTAAMVTDEIRSLQGQPQISAAELQAQVNGSGDSGGVINRLIPPVGSPITSNFGMRFHPILKRMRMHSGIDFGAPSGTAVVAAQSGRIIMAGWYGGYGNTVVIDHGNGISTLYGHNSSVAVDVGDRVAIGQVVSYSGSTGLSTGPHLHFEVRENGTPVNPLDKF